LLSSPYTPYQSLQCNWRRQKLLKSKERSGCLKVKRERRRKGEKKRGKKERRRRKREKKKKKKRKKKRGDKQPETKEEKRTEMEKEPAANVDTEIKPKAAAKKKSESKNTGKKGGKSGKRKGGDKEGEKEPSAGERAKQEETSSALERAEVSTEERKAVLGLLENEMTLTALKKKCGLKYTKLLDALKVLLDEDIIEIETRGRTAVYRMKDTKKKEVTTNA